MVTPPHPHLPLPSPLIGVSAWETLEANQGVCSEEKEAEGTEEGEERIGRKMKRRKMDEIAVSLIIDLLKIQQSYCSNDGQLC